MSFQRNEKKISQLKIEEANDPGRDQISLIDLWISMSRHKRFFLMVSSAVYAVLLTHALFFYNENYSVVTTLQIGTIESDNSSVPIESPASLLSKINNAIIPSYTMKWLEENHYSKEVTVSAENPKNTNVILLISKATKEDIDLISGYQAGLVETVHSDHQRIIDSIKSKIITKLNLARLELDRLQNPLTLESRLNRSLIKVDEVTFNLKKLEDEEFLKIEKTEFQSEILLEKNKIKRLDEEAVLLRSQLDRLSGRKEILRNKIDKLTTQIDKAVAVRAEAAANASESSAISQMMIDNEIMQSQLLLQKIEERYFVELDEKMDELKSKIESNLLQKDELYKKIEVIEERRTSFLHEQDLLKEKQRLKLAEANMEVEQIKVDHRHLLAKQEEEIREIKALLESFRETRTISSGIPSLGPTGKTKIDLIFIYFFLSVLLGVGALLIVLFREKVDERLTEMKLQ